MMSSIWIKRAASFAFADHIPDALNYLPSPAAISHDVAQQLY